MGDPMSCPVSDLTHTVRAYTLIVNAANEGIPIAAIARLTRYSSDLVREVLEYALASAHIGEIPKADWPPTARIKDRVPVVAPANSEEIEFAIKKLFRLTPLEAAFLVALLKFDHADKSRLHGIIEHQRNSRAQQPDSLEQTDQKMVDVMICKLRKRLKTVDPSYEIKTVWGSGYYIEKDVRNAILQTVTETVVG